MKKNRLPLVLILLLSGLALTMLFRRTKAAAPEADRIRAHTEALCNTIGDRPAGSTREALAADYIEQQLRSFGFSRKKGTLVRSAFTGLKDLPGENLLAVCNKSADGPVLLCVAHYDSVEGSPGARDNAAAVGILLELARVLGTKAGDLPAEIRLLFPGAEENGYHGSAGYVSALTESEKNRHRAVFVLDISAVTAGSDARPVCTTLGGSLDGAYIEGNFLEPADNRASRALAAAARSLYGREENLPVFHTGESDHVSFHNARMDAANLCWRTSDGFLPILPPEYHGADDVPETIDYASALKTAELLLEALRLLAGE